MVLINDHEVFSHIVFNSHRVAKLLWDAVIPVLIMGPKFNDTCVYCNRFVCSYMYMNVILLVILYQLSFYTVFIVLLYYLVRND